MYEISFVDAAMSREPRTIIKQDIWGHKIKNVIEVVPLTVPFT